MRKSCIVVLLMIIAIMCSGCGATKGIQPKFTNEDFDESTTNLLPSHDFSFATLSGKAIALNITYAEDGQFTLEDYHISNGKKLEQPFEPSDALHEAMVKLFRSNNAIVIQDPTAADYSASVTIKRIAAILENAEADWDNFGFNLNNTATADWGIIIEADVSINGGAPKPFRRVITLNKDIKLVRTGTYAVVASHAETEITHLSKAQYVDGAPLSNVAVVQKQDFTAALMVFVDNDWAGKITIYNPRTRNIDKEFAFDTDNGWDGVWTGKITDEKKAKALDYYSSPRGYLTILAYDLMEYVFEELAKEGSNAPKE